MFGFYPLSGAAFSGLSGILFTESAIESVSLTDSTSGVFVAALSSSDVISLSDTNQGVLSVSIAQSDALVIVDSADASPAISLQSSDSLAFTETTQVVLAISGLAADELNITDSNQETLVIAQALSENITLSDASFNGFFDNVFDAIVVVDTVQVSLNVAGNVFDSISFIDDSVGYGGWNPIPSSNQGWSAIPAAGSVNWTQILTPPKSWTKV